MAAGTTSLGIKATNGVVVATEKKLRSSLVSSVSSCGPEDSTGCLQRAVPKKHGSGHIKQEQQCAALHQPSGTLAAQPWSPDVLPPQVDESTVQKIAALTPNIGVAYSGMGPDSRVLVRKARKQAQAYYRLYKEQIPVAQLCRELATVMQEFTRKPTSALLSKGACLMASSQHAGLLASPRTSLYQLPPWHSTGSRPPPSRNWWIILHCLLAWASCCLLQWCIATVCRTSAAGAALKVVLHKLPPVVQLLCFNMILPH